jgi:hypothetical protein
MSPRASWRRWRDAARDRRVRELTADVLALGAEPRKTWPGTAFRVAGGGL